MAFSKEYLVGLVAGILSVVTSYFSCKLIGEYKLNLPKDKSKMEKNTLYTLQHINGMFALVGLLILIWTILKPQ